MFWSLRDHIHDFQTLFCVRKWPSRSLWILVIAFFQGLAQELQRKFDFLWLEITSIGTACTFKSYFLLETVSRSWNLLTGEYLTRKLLIRKTCCGTSRQQKIALLAILTYSRMPVTFSNHVIVHPAPVYKHKPKVKLREFWVYKLSRITGTSYQASIRVLPSWNLIFTRRQKWKSIRKAEKIQVWSLLSLRFWLKWRNSRKNTKSWFLKSKILFLDFKIFEVWRKIWKRLAKNAKRRKIILISWESRLLFSAE